MQFLIFLKLILLVLLKIGLAFFFGFLVGISLLYIGKFITKLFNKEKEWIIDNEQYQSKQDSYVSVGFITMGIIVFCFICSLPLWFEAGNKIKESKKTKQITTQIIREEKLF